jgi:hypothetical protein
MVRLRSPVLSVGCARRSTGVSRTPDENPFVPNWRRVDAAYPDLLPQLYQPHQAMQLDAP